MCNQQHRCRSVLSHAIAAGLALAAMIVVMSGLASGTPAATLDNSWTTGGYAKNQGTQGVRSSALTSLGSLEAERLKKVTRPHPFRWRFDDVASGRATFPSTGADQRSRAKSRFFHSATKTQLGQDQFFEIPSLNPLRASSPADAGP